MNSIGKESFILKNFLFPNEKEVLKAIKYILKNAYWNDIYTVYGSKMSIKITNAGDFGWYSDKSGYFYTPINPTTKQKWPAIPEILKKIAVEAANIAGYKDFNPDCCLLNRYEVGSKLGLHIDKDEKDFYQPIVSFSLGIPATFLFGGIKKDDTINKILLEHNDVIVFGGKDRLNYHGVEKIRQNSHEILGNLRINLTFRKSK